MRKYSLGLAAICLGVWTSPVLAQSASSSAYALSVNQTVSAPDVADVHVTVGPLAPTSGSAPPSYDHSNTVASVDQTAALTGGTLGVGEHLQTGILTSNSTGTATDAQATATVNDFSLGLSADANTFLMSLFNISAKTIQSSSQANSVGGLDASGSTTIEGLLLSGTALGSLTFDGSLFVNPAPNTILLDVGGLRIVLNEQTMLGDGTTSTGITTNAIDISFNDFAVGTGLKNGNIILGHTSAFATVGQAGAVPEPATWAMMLLGFGAVGLGMRRRRSTTLLQAA